MTVEILKPRINFRPFKYPQANEFDNLQNKAHWLPDEVEFASDVQQYHTEFTNSERHAVRTILKLFTQTEQIVSDYWANVVSKWFKHPEIVMMARTFSAFEGIHARAYDKLNTELGLDSEEFYLSFLEHPELKKKMTFIENFLNVMDEDDIPLSLAVFSAFTEGVSLYSSFAILLNFQRFNKLKSVANIIAWSCRDESLHSKAGCWLFNELIRELNPTKEQLKNLEEKIKLVAKSVFEMEEMYINEIFLESELEGLKKEDMIVFIQTRINQKLNELGFSGMFEPKQDKVSPWFNKLVSGEEFVDFFESRSSNYTKGWNFESVTW